MFYHIFSFQWFDILFPYQIQTFHVLFCRGDGEADEFVVTEMKYH